MDSAASSLAVHCLYAGRHFQRRGRAKTQVHQLDGPLSGGRARLDVFHGYVLVRPTVRHEVVERATRQLNLPGRTRLLKTFPVRARSVV
jgi:hypothetical protein